MCLVLAMIGVCEGVCVGIEQLVFVARLCIARALSWLVGGWVLRLGFGVEHLLLLGWRGFGSDGQWRLLFWRCSLGECLLFLVAKG